MAGVEETCAVNGSEVGRTVEPERKPQGQNTIYPGFSSFVVLPACFLSVSVCVTITNHSHDDHESRSWTSGSPVTHVPPQSLAFYVFHGLNHLAMD